eukprot:TRINITY_DN1792_c0_g1_i13.p1 TRINITY_DN1792_c0_g1~~TRINITY_DN1792_c0_g1_i13.p1  ORF type:complete len:274 (+),score=44.55 TRINITY_DN1792_c0_g1_i13:60-881(+)
MYQLKSNDGQVFDATPEMMKLSTVLSSMLEESTCQNLIFPVQNVNSTILSKLLEYCKNYTVVGQEEGGVSPQNKYLSFEDKFVLDNIAIIQDLIKAADYLQISSFLSYVQKERIFLKSKEGAYFAASREICSFSKSLARRLGSEEATEINGVEDYFQFKVQIIPILDFSSEILQKIIEYCQFHQKSRIENISEEDIKAWDQEFVQVDQRTLFGLILAAKDLVIDGLLDLTCETVARMILGKTPEEIREVFSIKNYFTPEEEEAVRIESRWDFD